MSIYLVVIVSLFLGSLFVYIDKPMVLVMVLLVQSLVFSMMIFYLSRTSWFSYNLILVYSSGILVIFSYVTNIVPNMTISSGMRLFSVSMLMLLILMVLINLNYENSLDNVFYFLKHIFTEVYGLIMIMMVSILFFSMLSTIKVCSFSEGPLRMV